MQKASFTSSSGANPKNKIKNKSRNRSKQKDKDGGKSCLDTLKNIAKRGANMTKALMEDRKKRDLEQRKRPHGTLPLNFWTINAPTTKQATQSGSVRDVVLAKLAKKSQVHKPTKCGSAASSVAD